MAAIRVKMPAWSFDYNYNYGGASTNIGNASRQYPAYTYLSGNSNINKDLNPAFVQNAKAGLCGQGLSLYGYLNGTVLDPSIGDYNHWKEATHVWSMAIPAGRGVPIGLFTLNVNGGVYVSEDRIGPYTMFNSCLYIDTDQYLKYGSMYRGASMPPIELYNYGVDMSPYLYTPGYLNTQPYIGHRYGLHYNLESSTYDLYVDNTATKLASINKELIMTGLLNVFGSSTYNDYYAEFGGVFNNYYHIGPGVYMNGVSSAFNVFGQGNVYYSDWVGWETSLNIQALNAVMDLNYSIIPMPKNRSSYGAFNNCDNLQTMVFPGSMETIPNYILKSNNLTSVTFRNGISNISRYAVNSRSRLEVHLPQTATNISSDAVNAPTVVLQSPISYNAWMRHNMLTGYTTDYPFEHYERAERLAIENIPSKQLRPNVYAVETRNGISNTTYNSPSKLKLIYNQPEIEVTANDKLEINWCNANISVMFNQAVDSTRHSNAVGFQPYDMTDGGFAADIYSREFPELAISQHFNFINDHGFIIDPGSTVDTVGSYNVRILGHANGNFVAIPAVLDDAYVVNSIYFTTAGHNMGPAFVDIEVPRQPVDISSYNTILNIAKLPAGTVDVQIRDGDIAYYTDAAARVNCAVSNVNDLYFAVATGNIAALSIVNSYNLHGRIHSSLPLTAIVDNFITVGGSFTSVDLSAAELDFKFWRTSKPVYVNAALHNDAQLLTFLGHDDVGIYCDNYYSDVQKTARHDYRTYLNALGSSATEGQLVVSRCSLPDAITVRNVWEAAGYFINCQGNVNVTMQGYIMPVRTSGASPYMFNKHIGIINFNAELERIPLGTHIDAGVNNSPLQLATNCNIGTLRVSFTDNYSEPNSKAFLDTRANMYAVSVRNCNIDTLVIDSPNTYYQLYRCNINHIIYTGMPLKRLYLEQCNIHASMQPIFDNSTDSDLYLYQTNLYADEAITIHRGQLAHTLLEWSPYASTPSCLQINGPSSITVIDDTRLAARTPDVVANAPSLTYKGRFAPYFGTLPGLQAAHIECAELAAGAFNNCRNLTTVTGLENCLYIGANAFENCTNLASITVHPNCSIHPNAFKGSPQITVHYGNGAKYPVDLNVAYRVARTTAAPANWGSLKDRLDVNIVYNDGTEEPTTDFYITPDFPVAYNAAYSNTYHIVRANGVRKRILAPYNRTNMTGASNTYNTVKSPRTTVNYSVSALSGMLYDIKNDSAGFAYINCYPAEVTASTTYKTELYDVHSLNAVHSLVVSGNYNCWYPAFWSGTGTISRAVLNVITTNTAVRNGVTVLWSNRCTHKFEYLRDDCAYMNAAWVSSGNNRTQYQGVEIHTLDLQRSNYSTYALGNNMILDCNIYELLLPNSARMNVIANNAVRNCNSLYWVDMNMLTNANFRINDNAFINCYSLCRLRLPAGTDYVGNGAFNRTSLKHVEAPAKCRMGTNAFPADCVITYY